MNTTNGAANCSEALRAGAREGKPLAFECLDDEHWGKVAQALPPLPRRSDNRGRPWNDPRKVLDGILWVMTHRATWPSLPQGKYPPFQTCHRWFQRWLADGTLEHIVELLADELSEDSEAWFSQGEFSGLPRRHRGASEKP